MQFYTELGYLAFGSRLRRLSEGLIAEINGAYRRLNIPFDASWFPVFYLLDREGVVSIREISDQAGVSHSAVSQLVSILQEKGLVHSVVAGDDARKKALSFSAAGEKLLLQVKPVWEALRISMERLAEEEAGLKELLRTMEQLEKALQRQPLSERITKEYRAQ